MGEDLHLTNVAVDEGQAFIERNHLQGAAASLGGLTWGLMRALYECPICGPGQYRYSPKDVTGATDWNVMVCSKCGNMWRYVGDAGKAEKPKRKRKVAAK